MFKVANTAAALAILAGARGTSAECSGVISTFTGDCNYENFVANLDTECSSTDLFAPGEGEGVVTDLCAYDAPVQFVEIQGTYQKDRRYFAGGGQLVDGGDWSVDSAQVQRFEANLGDKTLISFPEYFARVNYNNNTNLGLNGYPANMNLEASCDLKTVMCCFTDDTKFNSFAANGDLETDVCRHDLYDSPESSHIKDGWSVFPGQETSTHCVGFTWNDSNEDMIGNMMYDISLRNSINKGYLKGIPGAPLCGCVEHMPVVAEAACRTASKTSAVTYKFTYDADVNVSASNSVDIEYSDCTSDLATEYKNNHQGDADAQAKIDAHIVGSGGCADDLVKYLNDEEFLKEGENPDRYIVVDPTKWSDLFVGEGTYFLPPDIDEIKADEEFRALIEAGCKDVDPDTLAETDRHCIIRRVCHSCFSVPHRDIYYKRLSDLPLPATYATPGANFLDMFMNEWKNSPMNVRGVDFDLYSTYSDALAGENAWEYCNFNHNEVGFPRDCGPKGRVNDNWNSYVRSGGSANHHGFYVEKPPMP